MKKLFVLIVWISAFFMSCSKDDSNDILWKPDTLVETVWEGRIIRDNIENKIVLGHIGNFQPVKNVGFIIDVMKALCDISDKYCLIFIGDGPEKNSAIRKVRDLKLEQNVIFLPYQKQVEKYYQVMDYFLLPSFFEGLPLVGIEAQAAGVYTLFSDRITREVRISNGCSFLPITRGVENWVNVITQKKWKREDWSLNKWAKNYDSNNHKNIIDELF